MWFKVYRRYKGDKMNAKDISVLSVRRLNTGKMSQRSITCGLCTCLAQYKPGLFNMYIILQIHTDGVRIRVRVTVMVSLVLDFGFSGEIPLVTETIDLHMAKSSSYNSVIILPDNPIDFCNVEHSLLLKTFFFVFQNPSFQDLWFLF